MELAILQKAQKLYGTPEQFFDVAQQMVHEEEWLLISLMEERDVPDGELRKLVLDNGLAVSPADFIRECYHRGIINKVYQAESLTWHIGTFYRRFSYYAQYEFYPYSKLPVEVKDALNDWQFSEYLSIYAEDVKAKMRGEETYVHNSDFLTLEEACAFVDKHPDNIYVHACNCKSQYHYRHDKPICVCMHLFDFPNSEGDRGYGEKLTAEEAKKRLRQFNRAGLMHNGEEMGFCNCEGTSCYPLLMAKELGSRGMYPKSHYHIDWHADECVSCGRCVQVCNFQAFRKDEEGKVVYDADKCWGCTLCADNCPKGAIHLIPRTDVQHTDAGTAVQAFLNHK